MAIRENTTEGSFSWVDLMTTDRAAAQKFYGKLFGWKFEEMPVSDGSIYAMASVKGTAVGAIFEMGEEKKAAGMPAQFQSYIAVDDVDVKICELEAAAGIVHAEPFDVMDAGRMAVVADGRGAVFCLWQSKGAPKPLRVNEPGCLCWNELNTRDPEGAEEFYTSIFDWTFDDLDDAPDYSNIKNQGKLNCGLLNIEDNLPDDVPEHWNVYFAVADCDATVALAKKLGGKEVVAAKDIGAGRFAVLTDPQGARFSVIELPTS